MAVASAPPDLRPEPDVRRRSVDVTPLVLPWVVVLGFAIVAGIAARLLILDRLSYQIWADRDLARAEEMFQRPWLTGAEFDRGGRTPGGFYYLLLKAYLLLGRGPERVHLGTVALDVVALVALALVLRRRVGWAAGLAAAAFYACSPVVIDQLRFAAYNPTNALAFGVLAHVFFLEALLGRRPRALPIALILVALAAQIHFSYALLVPVFALVLAVKRVRLGGRAWALALAAFVAAYVPYLVADGLRGWPNLREIGARQDVLATPAALALVRGAPPGARPRLDTLLNLLFAFPPGVATPWRSLGSLTLYRVGAWRLFPLVMLTAFLISGAWTSARGGPGAEGTRRTWRAASAALLVIAAGVLLLSVRNTSFVIRYVLFLVPAVAVLHGCAFQAFADALAATPRSWRKAVLKIGRAHV